MTGITDGEWLAIFVKGRRRSEMVLTTFSFQAPAFYAKHGFEVVAVVDDHPHGHGNLLLRKRFGGAS